MAFIDRLKEARLYNEMTQEQLAEKIGVAKSTYTGYEKGNSEPNMLTISKLMNVLKVDANFLWQDEMDALGGSPVKLKYNEMKHIEKYRDLDQHGKDIVNTVLEKEYQRIKSEQTEEQVASEGFRLIHYYQRLASAGSGQFVFDNIPVDMIEIPNIPKYQKVKYAIGVNGHSMEPEYYEGDKLLIEPTDTIEYGEIGIFISEGDAFVKKLGTNELVSINEDYDNIPFTPNTRCVGRVIDRLNDLDVLSEENLNAIRNGINVNAESSLVQNW